MKLHRTAGAWSALSPSAVADASRTNQISVLEMMQQDIAELHRRLAVAQEALQPLAEVAESEMENHAGWMKAASLDTCRAAAAALAQIGD